VSLKFGKKKVKMGAKLNVKNKQGNTPLHMAFAFQNRPLANALIGLGSKEPLFVFYVGVNKKFCFDRQWIVGE
jgi:ankyrin repeat protein